MKIISLQKNLQTSLYATSHIAQKNTTLPILNNILISANEGTIKLMSTNLEIGITSVIRGKIEEEGAFTVDARTISEYVSLLDSDKVLLSSAGEDLAIECGEYKTKIKGLPADEFPVIPNINRDRGVSINKDEFKRALSQIVFSVSTDESRSELSGVFFSISGDSMLLVGTDSYRLSEKKITVKSGLGEDCQFILPVRTAQELVRVVSAEYDEEDGAADLVLYISENQCLFTVGGIELVSRLIDGRYPDYKQIIPTKNECIAIVPRDELMRAVKAAAIFSRSGVNDVILSFIKDGLEVSAASSQTGEQSAKILSNTTGKSVSITLNHRYLLDGLNALSGPELIFEVVDDETPCLIKDKADKEYMYLIMPIKK